jgi:phage gp36-like protein
MAYATIADFLLYGLEAQAWGTATDSDVSAELDAASGIMDDFFNGRYSLPLLSWPVSITQCCCAIAAYLLIVSPRGYNAGAGQDENLRKRYDDMTRLTEGQEGYLRNIQRRALHPRVVETANEEALEQPFVITSSVINDQGAVARNRGW